MMSIRKMGPLLEVNDSLVKRTQKSKEVFVLGVNAGQMQTIVLFSVLQQQTEDITYLLYLLNMQTMTKND